MPRNFNKLNTRGRGNQRNQEVNESIRSSPQARLRKPRELPAKPASLDGASASSTPASDHAGGRKREGRVGLGLPTNVGLRS